MPSLSSGRHRFCPGELIAGTSYRVLAPIGAGGMSAVYAVEHIELGRRFVLKVLLSDLAQRADLVRRTRNEWRALGRLQHPNIVTVTDAGVTQGRLPYFVMEWLDGETLAARLARQRCLLVPEALAIADALLSGLEAAHAIGIVHRDIKPQNIYLPARAPLKLLDFGIAKLGDESSKFRTRDGMTLGTPRYMSPEQAQGDTVDGRADLYSVGLVMFEMVAGRGAFAQVKNQRQALAAQLEETPTPLERVVPGVATELSRLIQELLAKAPGERPPSAAHVRARLAPLRARYEAQISTTSITAKARYDARTLFRSGPGLGSAADEPPLHPPTETLEGIPWSVDADSERGKQSGGSDPTTLPRGTAAALSPGAEALGDTQAGIRRSVGDSSHPSDSPPGSAAEPTRTAPHARETACANRVSVPRTPPPVVSGRRGSRSRGGRAIRWVGLCVAGFGVLLAVGGVGVLLADTDSAAAGLGNATASVMAPGTTPTSRQRETCPRRSSEHSLTEELPRSVLAGSRKLDSVGPRLVLAAPGADRILDGERRLAAGPQAVIEKRRGEPGSAGLEGGAGAGNTEAWDRARMPRSGL